MNTYLIHYSEVVFKNSNFNPERERERERENERERNVTDDFARVYNWEVEIFMFSLLFLF